MPDDFPPELDHVAPKWFHQRWEKLIDWCHDNRPVAGAGVTIVDAPGGGQMISADGSGSTPPTEVVYIAVDGQIYAADVCMTLGDPV